MPQNSGIIGAINVSGRHSSVKNLKAWFLGWLPLAFGLFLWFRPDSDTGWIPAGAILGPLTALAISVGIHEIAHFVAGRTMKTKPWCLRIGRGETVFDRQYNSFRLILKSQPYSGAVYPFQYGTKTKQFITVLAGPFANILLFVLFGLITLDSPKNQEFTAMPMQMMLVNAYLVLTSLIPYYHNGRPNDAMILLNAVRKAPDENTNSNKPTRDIYPSWFWYVKEVPANRLLDPYRKALDHPGLTTEQRGEMFDVFITGVLMYGATEFLAEADQYSEELLRLRPDEWTVKGTRGSVLIEKGNLAAGMAMLIQVMTNDTSAFDRAISASFLALAELKQNNRVEALKWLKISRSLDPHCPSMLRIAALLNSSHDNKEVLLKGADNSI